MAKYTLLKSNKCKNTIKSTIINRFDKMRAEVKGSKGELLKRKNIDEFEAAYNAGDKQAMERINKQRSLHEAKFQKARDAKAYQKSLKKPFRDTLKSSNIDVEAGGDLYVDLPSRI